MIVKNNSNYPSRVLAVALLLLLTLISCSNESTPVHTVTFNANGGTINGAASSIVDVAEGSPVAPLTPEYLGYEFEGWFVDGNDSEAYNFSTPVNSNLTLVAKWSPRNNTVIFDVGSGTGGPSSQIVTTGNKVTRPDSNPTREGYLFAGWFKADSFEYYDFSAPVNRDLTIVAKWVDPQTLTFTPTTTPSDGYSVKRSVNDPPKELAIPATYQGKPVVDIVDSAFNGAALTAIAIPNSVELMGDSAFVASVYLSTVTFEPGSKLSEIGPGAFSGASSFYAAKITSIEIPKSVTTIGDSAFHLCNSLSTITFESGSSLTTIGQYAFGQTAITSITIPESVTTMESSVFYNCDKLQTIYIGTEDIPSGWDPDWKAGCNARVINSKGQTVYCKYNVTFDANGGAVDGVSSITRDVVDGSLVAEPENPVWDGYRFDGWYIAGEENPYDFTTPVTSNLTLVAKWSRLYSVTFVSGESSTTSTVVEGSTVVKPADPVKDGYTFDGWYIDGADDAYDFNIPVNSDLTLEAKWSRIYYNVSFNANGGTLTEGTASTSKVEEGATITKPADPVRTGYTFAGWYVENTEDIYSFGTQVYSDLTLVAKWTPRSYTITFDANDGTGVPASQTVASGETVSKPDVEPTRVGHIFEGWFEKDSDSEYDFNAPVYSDLTLVAKLTRNHFIVTFKPNGGTFTGETSVPVENGQKLTAPEEPSKTGYQFAGWYIEGTNSIFEFLITPITSDLTLVALWQENSDDGTLTFIYNESIGGYSVKKGTAVLSGALEIPELFNGKPVKAIGDYAFYMIKTITDVTIPASVETIGNSAFQNSGITSIEIPASVKTIGNSAFHNCASLSTVTFVENSNLSSIGNGAFRYDRKLTSIKIPASVIIIGGDAFYECTSLKTVTFDEDSKLSSIGSSAFSNASALTGITIPATVTSMSFNVFYECSALQTIRIGTEDIPEGWHSGWKNVCSATVINCKGVTLSI